MRRILANIISVIHSFFRMLLLKIFNISNLDCYFLERLSPNVVFELEHKGRAYIGKRVRIHSGSKIKVRRGGKLYIGDEVKINYNCIIIAHDSIEIGSGTEFGPSVYVYDHDHDYRSGLKTEKYKSSPVKIGKNCWIGANVIILQGTELGDNCVVAAGTVVRGKYPSNSLLYQQRKVEIKSFDFNNVSIVMEERNI